MKQDLANREKDIHWPRGFDPSQADLFSHNELLINASCERIWSHIIAGASRCLGLAREQLRRGWNVVATVRGLARGRGMISLEKDLT